MEFKERPTDLFEQLITETLYEELGSPPSAEVWRRIAEEITQPPAHQSSTLTSFFSFLQSPIVRSTFIVALFLTLLVPRIELQSNDSSLQPRVVPTKLPYSPPIRPVPESDLRPTLKRPRAKANLFIEQEQPPQLGTWGLGARGEVIFSSVIQAKPVIEAPNQNYLLGSELDQKELLNEVQECGIKRKAACSFDKTPPLEPQPARKPKQQPDNKYTAA